MTRKEAVVIQKAIRENLHETGKDFPYRDEMIPVMKESCDMAIKALEQESCEDVISRSYALNVINLMKANIEAGGYEAYSQLFDRFDNVPPATPKRKVGEWIKKNNDYFDWYECSECGYGSDGEMKYNRLYDVRTKFCPDCGSQNLKSEVNDGDSN